MIIWTTDENAELNMCESDTAPYDALQDREVL